LIKHSKTGKRGNENQPLISPENIFISNAQGELTALEIGLHALACVGKAEGKRTKGGVLAKYLIKKAWSVNQKNE